MEIIKLHPDNFPASLAEIPQPPKTLYICGTLPPKDVVYLAIVGSRKHTNYGRDVCEKLISGLRGYPIVIVSGLALGIDSIAHKSAREAGLTTLAIPGSGLGEKVLYPATNLSLARKIVEHGGCLLSEYEPDFRATIWSFPQRNRIMAGLCKAVLIIEAEEKSGTLITARLATEYNRDVFTVPGSIFSSASKGTHQLIRLGATPITNSSELLDALGFEQHETDTEYIEKNAEMASGLSSDEKVLYNLLTEPQSRDELIRASDMSPAQANALLSIMEIKGLIKETMGEIRRG